MNEYTLGQVVYSKCGRDKGRPFIVVSVNAEYIYLIDGSLRTIERPKKKKIKHVQSTHVVVEEIRSKLEDMSLVTDAEVKKALKPYQGKSSSGENKEV